MKLPDLLKLSVQSFTEFWVARDARERMMLMAATLVASMSLVYAVLISPALSGREQLNKSLPVLRQQAAQMQALSKEAATLSGKSAAPPITLSREDIEAALARKGLKPQNVMLTGDMVKVQLASGSFSAMLNWLNDMQRTAQLAVIEANVVVLPQPDMVNAMLTLRQPRNE
ncbi:MAG: type II secretion system protein M [Nitrosomonadales bacterium]|nr:type II secretion system protein M [Nitrosomonadales bacterium]